MINRILILLFILITCCVNYSRAQTCIAASDFGQGGYVYIPAAPGADGGVQLLETKSSDQVARWIETDMFTGGASAFDASGNRIQRNVLKMYVEGRWYPFGNGSTTAVGRSNSTDNTKGCAADKVTRICNVGETPTLTIGGISFCQDDFKKCPLLDCNGPLDSRANNSVCLPSNGKTVDLGGKKRTNVPCCMDGGWGLYGLIALQKNTTDRADPNLNAQIAKTPPSYDFRTFRVAPLRPDQEGQYIEIEFTEQCNLDVSNNSVCLGDPNGSNSGNVISKGRLYFQIRDRNYDDNNGYYTVNVVSGVYGLKGFIEETVEAFKKQMLITSDGMYQLITKDFKFISIVRAMLLLYVVLFGAMFAMGMIRATQAELIIRLFKISIVSILISDQSFEFFNQYLFSLVNQGAESIAKIIYDATLFYSDDKTTSKFLLPNDASPLSIFDILVKMLLSRSLHIKIWSLVFVKWYVILIPLLYVAIFFILIGIVRAVVIYVTAIVLMALMLVIAPIFIAMILFQLTKNLFDGWLKLFISTGMMMIVIAAVLAIMVTLFMNQTENLFTYGACWTFIRTIAAESPFFLDWFDLYFWYPSDMKQALDHLTTKNFFAFLFLGVIFKKVMEDVPKLIDTLASSHLSPFSRFTLEANRTLDSAVSTAAGVAQAVPAYVLMDNAAAQKAGEAIKRTQTYKSLSKDYKDFKNLKAVKFVSGVAGVGTKLGGAAMNAPGLLDQAMHTSPGARDVTLTQAGSAIVGSAMQGVQGYGEAKNSKWYDPGISTEVKAGLRKTGWSDK